MTTVQTLMFAGLLFFMSGCQYNEEAGTSETATENVESTPVASDEMSKKVVEHHLNSFVDNDMEAVMSDYAEDAILVTPDSTFSGKEAIRGFFAELMPAFPTGESTIELQTMYIKGHLVYIVWHGSSPMLDVPFATDTFIIEDDMIKVQTLGAVINPVAQEDA